MAKHFFPLCAFIQVTVGFLLAHVCGQLTIQVSEHGLDTPSCLQNEITCKTLTYVLWELATVNSKTASSVTVIVTYNQTISTANKYNYNISSSVRSMTITGNKELFINFRRSGSLRITHGSSTAGLNWTWTKLGFAWFGPQASICRNPALQ